jgi:hypothetical protein
VFYLDLFAALDRHHVDYVLIGGLAVSLHGVERATMDIDITVAMTPDNLDALTGMAQELGMRPVLPVPLASLTDLVQLERWHRERQLEAFALSTSELRGVTLDILLYPPVDFQDMLSRAVRYEIRGTPVVVVAIDDLIALKEAVGRPIDLTDIAHLKRLREA